MNQVYNTQEEIAREIEKFIKKIFQSIFKNTILYIYSPSLYGLFCSPVPSVILISDFR